MHQYSYPADDLPLMVDLTRRTVNCAEHHWWYWPPRGGGWKLVCGEPVQLHLTSMMVLARIGKRGMVRTLVGECRASLSWPWGELVCREPAMTAPALCSLRTGKGCWQDVYGNWSCSVWWLSEDIHCLHGYGWMVGGVMRVTGNAMPFLKPFTVRKNGLCVTKKDCDRWPWMATPFQWTLGVCV